MDANRQYQKDNHRFDGRNSIPYEHPKELEFKSPIPIRMKKGPYNINMINSKLKEKKLDQICKSVIDLQKSRMPNQ